MSAMKCINLCLLLAVSLAAGQSQETVDHRLGHIEEQNSQILNELKKLDRRVESVERYLNISTDAETGRDQGNDKISPSQVTPLPVGKTQQVLLALCEDQDGSARIYNPDVGVWRKVSSMAAPRYQFAAAVLENKVYACGGVRDSAMMKTCELYDPVTDSWNTTAVAPMLEARQDFALAELNGHLYAVGGWARKMKKSVERYDRVANRWSPVAELPSGLSYHAAVSLGDSLYVAGGYQGEELYSAALFRYDPVRDFWTRLPGGMHTGRDDLALIAVPSSSGNNTGEGFLYAIAGHDGHQNLDSVERYSTETNFWQLLDEKLSHPRDSPGAALMTDVDGSRGRQIYVVGGSFSDTAEKLHLGGDVKDSNKWSRIAPIHVESCRHLLAIQTPII